MVFPPPVGPSILTPTLLFSGKEPTAHFLNLLGLPVTEPLTPRPGLLGWKGRMELRIRTQNTSLCAGPPPSPAQQEPKLETAVDKPDPLPAPKS